MTPPAILILVVAYVGVSIVAMVAAMNLYETKGWLRPLSGEAEAALAVTSFLLWPLLLVVWAAWAIRALATGYRDLWRRWRS